MPDLLNLMVDSGAADLHVRVGIPPCYRDGGTLKRVEGPPCEQEDVEYLVKAIANDDEVQNIRTQGGADFGFAFGTKARFRVSAFKERGNMALVLRQIPNELLPLDVIGLDPGLVDRLLSTPRGMILVTGPTGSGKTTVIRLLCRLYEPQQGRILLDGRDIRTIPIADLRRQLGVVLQDTFLFSGNVADNLRLNAPISDGELQRICRDLGLQELLGRLPAGLETGLRERGGNLSSGERQLLAVARVAIRNPTVLVMDEATAFMDPATEATLQRDLDRLLQKRTAVVIAHRLATVEASDRILVLRRGELIEEGTHRELRARGGLYAQLAELQEKGLARL